MSDLRNPVFDEIARLKHLSRSDAMLARSDGISIRAVTFEDGADKEFVTVLSQWRSDAVEGFPNRFIVTSEGTDIWLNQQVLKVKDRILLLVLDATGRPFGHVGLMYVLNEPGRAVIDGVIRGVQTHGCKGSMKDGMKLVIDWAFRSLNLTALDLYVLSDNTRALRLYKSLNFSPTALIPLEKKEAENRTDWVQTASAASADKFFLKLELANTGSK